MAQAVKGSCKITNWSKYNLALVNRGDITFWFSDEVLRKWEHDNASGKVGRPFEFSDTAIECLLVLRELFRLPYRQTAGLANALVKLMQMDLKIPDYTSLAKRAAKLKIDLAPTRSQGKIEVVVDSTGLKVFGDGEWKARKFGPSKRRTWRKLHLAINPETQEIVAEVLTENSGHDADQVCPLLERIPQPIEHFYGDSAYDKWKVYGPLAQRGAQPIIPPQHNAKIKQHANSLAPPLPRDEAIRGIRHLGRRSWKKEIGYRRRSLGETAMFRLKTIFGSALKNRDFKNQQAEARLRCKILNHLTQRGLPEFEWN